MIAPITIQAVYRDGNFQPIKKLDLPNNTTVQVLVLPLNAAGKPTLFGIFPQLAVLSDDVTIIKQMLGSSLDKQIATTRALADDESSC